TKGDARHVSVGRAFLFSVWIAVVTAAAGVVIFISQFREFLGVVTILTGYWAFSGYRALRLREAGPTLIDAAGSVTALAAAGLFIWYLHVVEWPWSGGVIYSTLGTLVTVALYDLARFGFPVRWFSTLWLCEHIAKMIGAWGAAFSAFGGTVVGGWQPYS